MFKTHQLLAAAATTGAVACVASAGVFDATMYGAADPSSYGTQLAELNIASTAYDFPTAPGFTTSGFVNEFNDVELDRTELTSRVFRVHTAQNLGGLSLAVGDYVFAYTIRLVEESTNTVSSMREFQVGLLDFVGGLGMDGSVVRGRGFVSPTGGAASPLGGNAGDFEDLGMFGASLDWQWGPESDNHLDNDESITLLMFTSPTAYAEGFANFIAPPGQPGGVDPVAANAPALVPVVPAPGPLATVVIAAGAFGIRRRRCEG